MEEEDKSAPEAAAVTTPENPPYTEAQSEKQEDSKEYAPIGDVQYFEPGIPGDEGAEGDGGNVVSEGTNGSSPLAAVQEFPIDKKKAKKAAQKAKKKAKAEGKDAVPEPEPPVEPEPEPEKVEANPVRENSKKSSKEKKKAKKANKGKAPGPEPPADPPLDAEADAEKPEEPADLQPLKEGGKKDKKSKKKKEKGRKDESAPAKSQSASAEDVPPPPPPPPGDEPPPPNQHEGVADQDTLPPPPPLPPGDEPSPPEGEVTAEGTPEEAAKPSEDVQTESAAEGTPEGNGAEPQPDEPAEPAGEDSPEAVDKPCADIPVEDAKDGSTLASNDGDNPATTQGEGEGAPDAPRGDGTEEQPGDEQKETPSPLDAKDPAVAKEPSTAETTADDKPAATPATEDPAPIPEAPTSTEIPDAEEEASTETEKPVGEQSASGEVDIPDAADAKGDKSEERPEDASEPAGSDEPITTEDRTPAADGTKEQELVSAEEKPSQGELSDSPADDSGHAEIAHSHTEEKSADVSIPGDESMDAPAEAVSETVGPIDSSEKAAADEKDIPPDSEPAELPRDATANDAEATPVIESSTPDQDSSLEKAEPPGTEPTSDEKSRETGPVGSEPEAEDSADEHKVDTKQEPDEPAAASDSSGAVEGGGEAKVDGAPSEPEAVPKADDQPDDAATDAAVSEESKVEPDVAGADEVNTDAPASKIEPKTENAATTEEETSDEPASDDAKDESVPDPPAGGAKDESDAPRSADPEPSQDPAAVPGEDSTPKPKEGEGNVGPGIADGASAVPIDEEAAPEPEAQDETPPADAEGEAGEPAPQDEPAAAAPSTEPEPHKDDSPAEPATSAEPVPVEVADAALGDGSTAQEANTSSEEPPCGEQAAAGESQDKPSEDVKPSEDAASPESDEGGKGDDESAPAVADDDKQDEDIKTSEDAAPEAAVSSPDGEKPNDGPALEAADDVVAEKATQTDDDPPPAGDEPGSSVPAAEPTDEAANDENAGEPAPNATDGLVEKATQTDAPDVIKEKKPIDTAAEKTENEVTDLEPQGEGVEDAGPESKPDSSEETRDEPAGEAEGEKSVDTPAEPVEPAEEKPAGDDAPTESESKEAPAVEGASEEPVTAGEGEDPPKDEPAVDVAEDEKRTTEAEKGSEGDREPAEADATEYPAAAEAKEPTEPEASVEPTEVAKDEPAGPGESEATEKLTEAAKDEPAEPEAAVESVEGVKDEPSDAAEAEAAAEAEKPDGCDQADAEVEKPAEKPAEEPQAAQGPAATENGAAIDTAEVKDNSPAENATKDDRTPVDPPAAEAEALREEPADGERGVDDGNATTEAPVEAAAETTDDTKDQPVTGGQAATAEAPTAAEEEPTADKASEATLAPPADEPAPEAERPAESAPAGDERDDSVEPLKEDKLVAKPERSTRDAKGEEDDEGKDTLGPIPIPERRVAKTGENLRTTLDTPDSAQDLGESFSRPDDVAVCGVERSEESTALTGKHSHMHRGAVESATGAGGVDSFDTPGAEAQDASGERQGGGVGGKISPSDEVALSTVQVEQAADEDRHASDETASRTDESDKAIKAVDEPAVQQVQETRAAEPNKADTLDTEVEPSIPQKTKTQDSTGPGATESAEQQVGDGANATAQGTGAMPAESDTPVVKADIQRQSTVETLEGAEIAADSSQTPPTPSQAEQVATRDVPAQENLGEDVSADIDCSTRVANVDETPAEKPAAIRTEHEVAQPDACVPSEAVTAGGAGPGAVTASQELSEAKPEQAGVSAADEPDSNDTNLGDEPSRAVADSGSTPTQMPVEPAISEAADKLAADELVTGPVEPVSEKDFETRVLEDTAGASDSTPASTAAAGLPKEASVSDAEAVAEATLDIKSVTDTTEDPEPAISLGPVVSEDQGTVQTEGEATESSGTAPAAPVASSVVAEDHAFATVPDDGKQDNIVPADTDEVAPISGEEPVASTERPAPEESTPVEPGEPVIEAVDRPSPDELPVMGDEDEFDLVSPSELPHKNSVADSQPFEPLEDSETVGATVTPSPTPGEQAPVRKGAQAGSIVSPDLPEETVSDTAGIASGTSAAEDAPISPSEKSAQIKPSSDPASTAEPAVTQADDATLGGEPSNRDATANYVITEKPVGVEESGSAEPPVAKDCNSQKLAIVGESEVVGSEPSPEQALAAARDETLPGPETKSAAETTEEMPVLHEPQAAATAEDMTKDEYTIDDRAIVPEKQPMPAEVSALSEEIVLVSQPVRIPGETTCPSNEAESVLIEPSSQRQHGSVSAIQKSLEEPVYVDRAVNQPVQSQILDDPQSGGSWRCELSEWPGSQSLNTSHSKFDTLVGGSIDDAVPVDNTAAEQMDIHPRRTEPPADSAAPAEATRNEAPSLRASTSRGIGETLRADSPVIPSMLLRPAAEIEDHTRKRGIGKAEEVAPDVGNRSVSAKARDGTPGECHPSIKDRMEPGTVAGGGFGGGAGLAIAHLSSSSDKDRDKKPSQAADLQDVPQIPTRQGSLSASYTVVYSEEPSGGEEAFPALGKDREKALDHGLELKNNAPLRSRKSHLAPLNLDEQRADTPPIVLPTAADFPPVRPPPRTRQLRRARKMSIARAEEEIAAAVVIYASADALSPPGSPTREPRPFHFPADDGRSKEVSPAAYPQDSRMDSPTVIDAQSGDEDLRQSVADLFTDNDKSSDDRDRDRDRERRRRRRSSHHHYRSSRDGESSESRRHSHSSSHSHRHRHRSRTDSERSSRTPLDITPPRTPTRSSRRQDSGYDGEGSERSYRRHHRRSAEEYADYERRRERRLREKEREAERDRRASERDRRDNDRIESRDSDRERHRRSRPGTSRSYRDIPRDDSPPKKSLGMEYSRGVLAGPADAPKDVAPPSPPSYSRGDFSRRSNTTRPKLGRSRRSEDIGGRPHRSRTGDERIRRRSEERLRSDDKMRLEDRLRYEEQLRYDDRLPRKGEGEGTRAEEARRRARQEERMRAREKDDEKSGFRAAIKKLLGVSSS